MIIDNSLKELMEEMQQPEERQNLIEIADWVEQQLQELVGWKWKMFGDWSPEIDSIERIDPVGYEQEKLKVESSNNKNSWTNFAVKFTMKTETGMDILKIVLLENVGPAISKEEGIRLFIGDYDTIGQKFSKRIFLMKMVEFYWRFKKPE